MSETSKNTTLIKIIQRYVFLTLLNIIIFETILVTLKYIIDLVMNIISILFSKQNTFVTIINSSKPSLLYLMILIAFLYLYIYFILDYGKSIIQIIILLLTFPIYCLKTLFSGHYEILEFFIQNIKIFILIFMNVLFFTYGYNLFITSFNSENILIPNIICGILFMNSKNAIYQILNRIHAVNPSHFKNKIHTILGGKI